jgi:hypothetical protein
MEEQRERGRRPNHPFRASIRREECPMTTGDTRTVTLDDATSLTLVVEHPADDHAVARLEFAGRAFRLVATREPGGDGEPATWRAEVVELPGAGGATERALGWEDSNVGYASADAALEETARRVARGDRR